MSAHHASAALPGFRARAFARGGEDLDIEFDAQSATVAASELLLLCLRAPDGSAFEAEALRHWSVAERLQGLLAIARASVGEVLPALARCLDRECAGQIELELGLRQFERVAPADFAWSAPDGHTVRCRLPTPVDLQAWWREGDGEEGWLARRLLLQVDGRVPAPEWPLPDAWLAPMSQALQDVDPLTALTLEVPCPFCGRATPVAIDLETLLLDALRRRQHAVLEEVHRLARAYHWSEAQIVAMPAWRRRRYLARVQAEFA
jgi:hypothetical protein